MKTGLSKKYPYSAQYYGYILINSADGTVTERQYNVVPKEITVALSVNLLGELKIESLEKLQLGGKLSDILDKNGEEIYSNGVWEITKTAPILEAIGVKGGYVYLAKLISGEI